MVTQASPVDSCWHYGFDSPKQALSIVYHFPKVWTRSLQTTETDFFKIGILKLLIELEDSKLFHLSTEFLVCRTDGQHGSHMHSVPCPGPVSWWGVSCWALCVQRWWARSEDLWRSEHTPAAEDTLLLLQSSFLLLRSLKSMRNCCSRRITWLRDNL